MNGKMIRYNKERLDTSLNSFSSRVKNTIKNFFEDDNTKEALEDNNFPFLYALWPLANVYLTAILLAANVDFLPYLITIPDHCFCDLPITEISLPDNIKDIGIGAFEDCEILEKVNLSSNLDSIKRQAFNGTAIKSIYLSNTGINLIGSLAFANCQNLEEVTLPATLTTLYTRVFEACPKLTQIAYLGTAEEWMQIDKSPEILFGTKVKVIKCSDKDIAITDRD